MRRLRRRFNEKLRSLKDVEKHIMKNIDSDYEDVAESIIDQIGIDEVVRLYLEDWEGNLVDIIYNDEAVNICKEENVLVVDAWKEYGSDFPKRIDTFYDIAHFFANILYDRCSGVIYDVLDELDRNELESLL